MPINKDYEMSIQITQDNKTLVDTITGKSIESLKKRLKGSILSSCKNNNMSGEITVCTLITQKSGEIYADSDEAELNIADDYKKIEVL